MHTNQLLINRILLPCQVAWITKPLAGIDKGSKHDGALIEHDWHYNTNAFFWTLMLYESWFPLGF